MQIGLVLRAPAPAPAGMGWDGACLRAACVLRPASCVLRPGAPTDRRRRRRRPRRCDACVLLLHARSMSPMCPAVAHVSYRCPCVLPLRLVPTQAPSHGRPPPPGDTLIPRRPRRPSPVARRPSPAARLVARCRRPPSPASTYSRRRRHGTTPRPAPAASCMRRTFREWHTVASSALQSPLFHVSIFRLKKAPPPQNNIISQPIEELYNIISFKSFSRSVGVEVFHYKGGKFEEAYKFHNQIINLLCTKVKYFHNDSEGQNLKKNNQRSIPTPKIKKSPGTKAFDFSIEH